MDKVSRRPESGLHELQELEGRYVHPFLRRVFHQIHKNEFVISGRTRLVGKDRVHHNKVLISVRGPLGRPHFSILLLPALLIGLDLFSVQDNHVWPIFRGVEVQELCLEGELSVVLGFGCERSQPVVRQFLVTVYELVLLKRIGNQTNQFCDCLVTTCALIFLNRLQK